MTKGLLIVSVKEKCWIVDHGYPVFFGKNFYSGLRADSEHKWTIMYSSILENREQLQKMLEDIQEGDIIYVTESNVQDHKHKGDLKMSSNILVRFDVNGMYSLTVYLDDLKYEEEQEKHGEKLDEAIYDKALEKMQLDGVSLPAVETWYEVEAF